MTATKPRFKIGDRVYVPHELPVIDALRGAHGVIFDVYPDTDPGAEFVGPKDKLGWSTSSHYLVDFGSPVGRTRVDEAMLEPE